MAHQLRALVTIPMDSNMPADAITNTFYVDGGQPGDSAATVADNFHDDLSVFYQAVGPVIWGNDVNPTLNVRYYNMADAKPRVPVHEEDIVVALATGNHSYPHEVAICMSFRAEYVSGIPNARRRGRIFLGPIRNNIHDDQTGNVYIPTATREVITAAADALAAAGNDTAQWSVYSPTVDATGTLDDAFQDVVAGWVDNAFDTIRSRGPKANQRSEWDLT